MKYLALMPLIAIPRPLLQSFHVPKSGWRNLLRSAFQWLMLLTGLAFVFLILIFGGEE